MYRVPGPLCDPTSRHLVKQLSLRTGKRVQLGGISLSLSEALPWLHFKLYNFPGCGSEVEAGYWQELYFIWLEFSSQHDSSHIKRLEVWSLELEGEWGLSWYLTYTNNVSGSGKYFMYFFQICESVPCDPPESSACSLYPQKLLAHCSHSWNEPLGFLYYPYISHFSVCVFIEISPCMAQLWQHEIATLIFSVNSLQRNLSVNCFPIVRVQMPPSRSQA